MPLISGAMRICSEHRQYSQMIVASEFMRNVLLYNGFDAQDITVCPYFTYERRINEEFEENLPIVLAMGRLVSAKGMHLLIKAFAGLKMKARLVIIGDGPDMKKLKALGELSGLNEGETFLGWLDNEACRKWIDRSTVVVVPSIWPEPFGIVGIEAMASGKPVVAFDSGGISEWLVQGQTGYLVPTGDIAALKEKIRVLLRDPELANEMGKNGFAYCRERFGPDVHLSLLLSIFKKSINKHATGPGLSSLSRGGA
jgi:glycosyltransferase involved in cell wall biosynthesis